MKIGDMIRSVQDRSDVPPWRFNCRCIAPEIKWPLRSRVKYWLLGKWIRVLGWVKGR